jgi:hypothetical protein
MSRSNRLPRLAGVALMMASVFVMDLEFHGPVLQLSFVSKAQAIFGRPRTPVSFAGVARRTTRRVIRRTTIYASTLPTGCAQTTVNGTLLYKCGATYYQPTGGQYVVVNVQ